MWSLADWQDGVSGQITLAALNYIVGMFLVKAFGSVPMDNKLKINESDEAFLMDYWNNYQLSWRRLNLI